MPRALCRPRAVSRRPWRDSGFTPEVTRERESSEVATKGSAERKYPWPSVPTRKFSFAGTDWFLKRHGGGITLGGGGSGSLGARAARRAPWERKETGLSQTLCSGGHRLGFAERAGAESLRLPASFWAEVRSGGNRGVAWEPGTAGEPW